MDSPENCQGGEDEEQADYAYMFRYGERRFLFICNFGAGVEHVGQLVKDLDTGEVLIRKVSGSRWLQNIETQSKPNWRPKKPHEIKMLKTITETFPIPEPDIPRYIAECYGHEYIKSNDTDPGGNPKYWSVSYWKLCNGGSPRSWSLGWAIPPVMVVARMIHQVFSTLQYIYTAGDQVIYHQDLHLGNIWAHWEPDATMPDFYVGDFADACFAMNGRGTNYFHHEPGLHGLDPHAADELLALHGPIRDVVTLISNLDIVVQAITNVRQDDAAKGLKMIQFAIYNEIGVWKNKHNTRLPPDLTGIITEARNLEMSCRKGGPNDETQNEYHIRYVNEERTKALKVQSQQPWVVHTTKQKALRPQAFGSEPLQLHGPWYLVRTEGGDWVHAEADGVMHHRPNHKTPTGEEGNLSNSNKVLGPEDRGWLETASSVTVSSAQSYGSAAADSEGSLNEDEILARASWRRAAAAAMASSKGSNPWVNTYTVRGEVIGPEWAQSKLKTWHSMIHEDDCKCEEDLFCLELNSLMWDRKGENAKVLKAVRDMAKATLWAITSWW